MANLKYKSGDNSWTSILLTRGATGPQGEPGQNGLDAEITLNGIKNRIAEFYAPISAGQAGQFLMSNGEGQAPTFASVPAGTETINNLTTSTFVENQALSAYQGYILNQNKVDKSTTIASLSLQNSISASDLKTSLNIPTTLTIGNTQKTLTTGNINWSLAEIGAAPSSHSHDYLPLSGGSLTGSPYIYFPASAGATTTSMPMAITYGRLQAYGTLCINADTDGSTTEYLILTAGRGMSSTASDGLAIGYSSLQWRGANVPTVYVQSGQPSAKQTGDIWIIP